MHHEDLFNKMKEQSKPKYVVTSNDIMPPIVYVVKVLLSRHDVIKNTISCTNINQKYFSYWCLYGWAGVGNFNFNENG